MFNMSDSEKFCHFDLMWQGCPLFGEYFVVILCHICQKCYLAAVLYYLLSNLVRKNNKEEMRYEH